MTDKELDDLYKANLDLSHSAALRLIYNIGHADGSGVALSTNGSDHSKAATKPTSAIVTTGKLVTRK